MKFIQRLNMRRVRLGVGAIALALPLAFTGCTAKQGIHGTSQNGAFKGWFTARDSGGAFVDVTSSNCNVIYGPSGVLWDKSPQAHGAQYIGNGVYINDAERASYNFGLLTSPSSCSFTLDVYHSGDNQEIAWQNWLPR